MVCSLSTTHDILMDQINSNLSPCEEAAQIAFRQNSGDSVKNLIFASSLKCDEKQIELSRAAQARRQEMENERRAKNHLIRNRKALKEKQQQHKRALSEREARDSLQLQKREKKKQELYGAVKARVFDENCTISSTAISSSDDNFKLSSLKKTYGKIPKYISQRKAKLESERWG